MNLKVCKVRPDAIIPHRGTSRSAGLDFFIPTYWNEGRPMTVKPSERILVPTGIKVDMIGSGLENYALILFNKSGIGVKKGLDLLACVIDADYTGEIFINVVNTDDVPTEIEPGKKLVQGIILPVEYATAIEYEEDDLFDVESERGAGAQGSTGE